MRRLDLVAAVAIGAMGVVAPAAARAHFRLTAPAAAYNQSSTGDPQKSAPCGQADNQLTPPGMAAVATNMVTPFTAGQTITITLTEPIFHPGHYRVALSTNGTAGLPADPPVTAGGQPSSACGTTPIQSPPVMPVLADGMLVHTTTFSGAQQFHGHAAAEHHLHQQLRASGDRVHVQPRGAVFLSPLRQHHDRGGDDRYGWRGWRGRRWQRRAGGGRRRGWPRRRSRR